MPTSSNTSTPPNRPRPSAPARAHRPSRSSRAGTTPSQGQLLFPLLEVMEASGGQCTPAEAAERLADRFALSPEQRDARVFAGEAHGDANQWKRTVRFVREKAKALGFVTGPSRNLWQLTEAGRDGLRTARPGIVITVYETDRGVALYGTCESAMECLADGSVHCILTSPPYGLARSKAYESSAADDNVEWLLSLAARWKDLLTEDGTLLLNVGPAWQKGQGAVQSPWRQELVYRLCKEIGLGFAQTFYWHSPSKLPAPAEWVTIRRCRITESVEEIFAFVRSPRLSRWDNRRVLTPYSDSMTRRLAAGGDRRQVRPSGHVVSEGGFSRDNGGAIPKNLLSFSHTDSNSPYRRHCRAQGLPAHPAMFPEPLIEFLVQLTTQTGDTVYDPFGGSLTTAAVCERLDRRWVSSERALTYLAGAGVRLQNAPGFVDHVGMPGLRRVADPA